MAQRWFPDEMPVPAVSPEAWSWWQAAVEHRLVVQRCASCHATRHPPRPTCPRCQSFEDLWLEVSGRGTVYTFTIVHRAYLAELADHVPYVVAVVELEGAGMTRLVSNVVDVDPDKVYVGMPVQVVWEDLGPELTVPRFVAV